jgi:hypothetical protein
MVVSFLAMVDGVTMNEHPRGLKDREGDQPDDGGRPDYPS